MGAAVGQDSTGPQELHESWLGDVLHAGARGAVGAMTMTGMRVITTEIGLVEQTPPQAIARQRSRLKLAAPHGARGVA